MCLTHFLFSLFLLLVSLGPTMTFKQFTSYNTHFYLKVFTSSLTAYRIKSKCLCMPGKSSALSSDFPYISLVSTQTVHLELLLLSSVSSLASVWEQEVWACSSLYSCVSSIAMSSLRTVVLFFIIHHFILRDKFRV